MCTATRLTIIGRQRLTRREARQMRMWCILVIVASPIAGLALERIDPGAAWGLASGAAMIAGLLIVITFINPKSSWRISERGVAHASTSIGRKRVRLDWDEIEQLRFGEESIGVRGRGKEVIALRRFFEKEDWDLARDLVRTCLSDAFDLDTPTECDLVMQRLRSLSPMGHALRWIKLVLIAILITAALVGAGFAAVSIVPASALWIAHAVALAFLGVGVIVALRLERSKWRRRIAQ